MVATAMMVIAVALAWEIIKDLFLDVCAAESRVVKPITYLIPIETYTSAHEWQDADIPWCSHGIANGQPSPGTLVTANESFLLSLSAYDIGEYCIQSCESSIAFNATAYVQDHLYNLHLLERKSQSTGGGDWVYKRISPRYSFETNTNWKIINRNIRKALLKSGVISEELRQRFANEQSVASIIRAIYVSNQNVKNFTLTELFKNMLTSQGGISASTLKANHVASVTKLKSACASLTKEQVIDVIANITLIEKLETAGLLSDTIRLMKMSSPEKLYGVTTTFEELAQEVQQWIDRDAGSAKKTGGSAGIIADTIQGNVVQQLESQLEKTVKQQIEEAMAKLSKMMKKTEGEADEDSAKEKKFIELAKGPLKYDRKEQMCKDLGIPADEWKSVPRKDMLKNRVCVHCGANFYHKEHFNKCPGSGASAPDDGAVASMIVGNIEYVTGASSTPLGAHALKR